MEETLMDCLVRVKEDLSELKRIRDYLNKNAETEERCSFSWRTIEAFNSILSVCTSQNTPETSALDTLLDSFYYLARNSADDGVWDNFGFELGIICVKVLSAIERSDIFEVLFSKLLSVITVVCKHNSGIWKAAARQILNVLINKKFSVNHLEDILKSYIRMIRNVENVVLHEFSSQNLDLLKTFSFLVQKLGDFEIQSNVVEMIFLHLSRDTKLMTDFFTTAENKLFQSLRFGDFEGDCRLFLNELNKSRKEPERKVYSVGCRALYLGGRFVEPPLGRDYVWVDANKDTERLSIKYGDAASNENRVVHVQFSELIDVRLDGDDAAGSRYLIIQTKNLSRRHEGLRNDEISLVAESADGMSDFINFLETVIREKKRKAEGTKGSKTVDCLFIDIRSSREVQRATEPSSNKTGVDHVLPGVFSPSDKANPSTPDVEMQRKTCRSLKEIGGRARTPAFRTFQTQFTVLGNRELSPNSFADSFSKHLGSDSPEPKHTFEDSVRTVEFLQKQVPERRSHKLFRITDKSFNLFQANESENFTFTFEDNKENNPPVAILQQGIKTRKSKLRKTPTSNRKAVSLGSEPAGGLKSRKRSETNLTSTQSQEYFQRSSNVLRKKKPRLPKLKRTRRASNEDFANDENGKNNLRLKERATNKGFLRNDAGAEQTTDPQIILPKSWGLKIRGLSRKQKKFRERVEIRGEKLCRQRKNPEEDRNFSDEGKGKETAAWKTSTKKTDLKLSESGRKNHCEPESPPSQSVKMKSEIGGGKKNTTETKEDAKPSLLDPNGYAYKRWCRPTTSERSNFWLKKLKILEKPKTDFSVFDFSEDSDFNCGKNIKKGKIAHSKRSRRQVETKQTSLQQAKEFLKRTPPKKEKSTAGPRAESSEQEDLGSPSSSPRAKEFGKRNSFLSDCSSVGSREKGAADEDSGHESVSDEDKEPALQNKKRELSDEDGSPTGTRLKKKPKTALPKMIFLSILRRRLQKAEERDRRQTSQIIQIVNEAVHRLLDRLQAKEAEKTESRLRAAEAASEAAEAEILALDVRAKRIRRAILYFEAGCSVSDSCKTLDEHFSRARDSLQARAGERRVSEAMDRIGDRLGNLIRSEAERTIENEWAARRDLLFKCAYLED